MKRIRKRTDSRVIQQNLSYPKDKLKIRRVLEEEQEGFCAYTEERISAGYSVDVEHFNPTLKNTPRDSYQNWFAASTQWNRNKSSKWSVYQPVLHPTEEDLEERIIYFQGDYIPNYSGDKEAENLILFLDLNNPKLRKDRMKHVDMLKGLQELLSTEEEFLRYLKKHDDLIKYRRALETEFGFQL